MADINNGWLRIAGEKFYAYSRPEAIKVDDSGTTLKDILDKFDTDKIINDIAKLQADYDALKKSFDMVLDNIGAFNIQTGVYSATETVINTLSADNRLDDNVLYIVTEDASLTSVVNIRVIWKTKEGQTLKSETYTGEIGDYKNIDFYKPITIGGITYGFTPSGSPITDEMTGNLAKMVVTPDSSSAYATTYYTKNTVLSLKAIS